MRNVGIAGLTFWSPTMNVARDPRWGRIQETPGECPYDVSRRVVAFVRALQDHYTAYDLDAWMGVDRRHFNGKALNNLYILLMRVGFFDGSPEYESLGKESICSEEHMELSIETARQGIVLLKNDYGTLPLDTSKLQSVAVIGPHAEATDAMLGNYAGKPCKMTSPKDAFARYAQVNFMRGCNVIHVGLDLTVEAEERDRADLYLPGYQTRLINEVAALADHPVILVIFSAGPVDVSFAQNNKKIGAIIWAGYPGEEGSVAVADIVFGKYNPRGRLPLTWYKNDHVKQLPMTSIQLRPDDALGYPGRTYKFFNGSVLYPFGFGLSYTQFCYNLVSPVRSVVTKLDPLQHCHDIKYKPNAYVPSCKAVLVEDIGCNQTIDIEVEVINIGGVDGGHVLMVYSIPPEPIVGAPLKQLIGFERVFVKAGSSTAAKFSINACEALSLVTETAYKVLPWGQHTISIGDGSGALTFPFRVNFEFYSNLLV
ncbi:hypothetical protein ACLOJK_022009 [Asimina triloba]